MSRVFISWRILGAINGFYFDSLNWEQFKVCKTGNLRYRLVIKIVKNTCRVERSICEVLGEFDRIIVLVAFSTNK